MIARRGNPVSSAPENVSRPRRQRSESGYAYLMVLFLVLAMVVLSQEAMQNLYTQGRREGEAEMIWRGNQYARAIRLFYRKTGHYPQDLDALKSGLPELHFLRYAAYRDPMNKGEDGAWRMIWVSSSGQITGSVRYATLQQMALMDLNGGQIPPLTQAAGLVGTPVSSMASGSSGATAQNSAPGGNSSGQPPSSGATTDNSAASSPGSASNPSASSDQLVNPLSLLKPTGPVDGPVLGAFLTGVGGGTKSDAPSIRVYNGGKKYKEWEFIWNPLEDQARAIQQGLSPQGQPIGLPAGAGGIGTQNPTANPTGFGGAIMPPPSQPQPQN